MGIITLVPGRTDSNGTTLPIEPVSDVYAYVALKGVEIYPLQTLPTGDS